MRLLADHSRLNEIQGDRAGDGDGELWNLIEWLRDFTSSTERAVNELENDISALKEEIVRLKKQQI